MSKSLQDNPFSNLSSGININGLSISSEAIEENKRTDEVDIPTLIKESTPQSSITEEQKNLINNALKDSLKDYKEKLEKPREKSLEEQAQELLKDKERLEQREEERKHIEYQEHSKSEPIKDNSTYIKKTMIFKSDYLDLINGLALVNDMQIKDVLNQLLERAISELDESIKEKALKENKRQQQKTTIHKNLF